MNLLMTNCRLAAPGGTEMYLRDIAVCLVRRGHRVAVYSPVLGEAAGMLRDAGIPVIDHPAACPFTPDVIHAQHHLPAVTAMARHPGCPAVYVCHGWRPWEERPPALPQIRRYIAVDEATRERIVRDAAPPPDRIATIHNFVDVERFQPRPPLPESPRRVLLFSNYPTPDSPYYLAAAEACRRAGLALDVLGSGFGTVTAAPEKTLAGYDIVLAQGRSAIEAMAVGAMVIICSSRKFGPPVLSENLAGLRAKNFGIRTQVFPVSADLLEGHLRRYNAGDAASVSARIREEAALDRAVDQLMEVYESARESVRENPPDPAETARAVADYLRALNRDVHEIDVLTRKKNEWEALAETWRAEAERHHHDLHLLRNSLTWRVRNGILRCPPVGYIQRWLDRRGQETAPDAA